MTFLIDTNIISEVRKGDRGDPAVATWWNGVSEDDLGLSSLVLGDLDRLIDETDDPLPAIDGERHHCLQGIAPPQTERERAAVVVHGADGGDD